MTITYFSLLAAETMLRVSLPAYTVLVGNAVYDYSNPVIALITHYVTLAL